MKSTKLILIGMLAVFVCGTAAFADAPKRELPHRWAFIWRNFLLDDQTESTVQLCKRIAKSGYNGVLLMDTKFVGWDTLPDHYRHNIKRIRSTCRELDLDVIAAVMPMGRASGLLAHDQDLAAAMPVKNAPFVVREGKIVPCDDFIRIPNGSFEQYVANEPVGWTVAQPGKITFIDTDVVHEGKASLRIQDVGANDPAHGGGKAKLKLKVEPFRYYHVSAAIKTEGFETAQNVNIHLRTPKMDLNRYFIRVKPTQDWTRTDLTFNSLDNEEVTLILDIWRGRGGKLWWDDVRIEPAGLVNAVRREGAPLSITSADGKRLYEEERDFVGARDVHLGRIKYPGSFDVWHKPPVPILTSESRISEGEKLSLSYYHTAMVRANQVMCCMS
ncbi:MAG: carbohydrate binding domain-containing protein, partial [Planctomycetota bacterium]